MSPPKKSKKNLRKSQIIRFRVTSACQKCKEKKTKCEEEVPCKNCRSHGYECIPVQATKRGPTPKKNKDRSGPDDPSSTSNSPKVPSEISGGGDCSSQPSENLELYKLFEQLIDMDAGAGE
ncbi:13869_t:CDS:1, partial [Funneliformis caledonium]